MSNNHPGFLFRCQNNDALTHKQCLSRHQAMPSYVYRAIRQAAPGHEPLKVNVKRSSVFMLEHHRGYQFGICFIELCPSHQGSTVNFSVPEATVSIFETSKNVALCLAAF